MSSSTRCETKRSDRDCAHARLVTRDGEIEITVSITGRTYIYKIFAPVARLGGLAPARPIIECS